MQNIGIWSTCALLFMRVPIAQANMQCYSCSWNVLESDGVVGVVLDLFNAIASDEHCKFEKEDDLYNINIRNCPPPGEGQVTKCSQIEGEITTTIGFFKLDVVYRTVTRDCVNVDTDDKDYTDGCHDSLPSYGPVRSVFQSFFGSTEIGDIEFKGKACYKTKDKYQQEFQIGNARTIHQGLSNLIIILPFTVLVSLLLRR